MSRFKSGQTAHAPVRAPPLPLLPLSTFSSLSTSLPQLPRPSLCSPQVIFGLEPSFHKVEWPFKGTSGLAEPPPMEDEKQHGPGRPISCSSRNVRPPRLLPHWQNPFLPSFPQFQLQHSFASSSSLSCPPRFDGPRFLASPASVFELAADGCTRRNGSPRRKGAA